MALTSKRSPFPRSGSPLSMAEVRKIKSLGPIYDYLKYFALRERRLLLDDFDGVALDTTNRWTVANGGGAAVASFAANVQENGGIRATTGTANGDTTTCSLIGAKTWYGERLAMIEMKWTPITAVTETRIELGFVDVIPGSNKPVANVIATPSVNTSVVDAAFCLYDHTGSTTTNELVAIGSAISATKNTFTPLTARVAATTSVIRINIVGNAVWLWNDKALVASPTPGTDQILGTDPVAPFALIRASNATSKSLDLDYIMVAGLRNG